MWFSYDFILFSYDFILFFMWFYMVSYDHMKTSYKIIFDIFDIGLARVWNFVSYMPLGNQPSSDDHSPNEHFIQICVYIVFIWFCLVLTRFCTVLHVLRWFLNDDYNYDHYH